MIPAIKTRHFTRAEGFGAFERQQGHIICRILKFLSKDYDPLERALNLRATSKTLKATIEDNQKFGIPFLKILGIKTDSEAWKDRIANENWIALCGQWMYSPLNVFVFDYSLSMNKQVFDDGSTHLRVGIDILKDIYESNRTNLRSEMIIYLFARGYHYYAIDNKIDFDRLVKRIEAKEIDLDRNLSSVELVFQNLFSDIDSPLLNQNRLRNLSILFISDQDIPKGSMKKTMKLFCKEALKGKITPTFHFIPTSFMNSVQEKNEEAWDIASKRYMKFLRSRKKSKASINLVYDDQKVFQQASKRIKIDDSESDNLGDLSFQYYMTPPPSPHGGNLLNLLNSSPPSTPEPPPLDAQFMS